ncbi:HEPN domain-containing protein [Cytobacillus firmus]|uniref:ApeA N-terminal domain 1-containing protein n=1 Tax=Cytobacillus firmus TaxID=1399 RepID=UPI001CFCDD4E|nr:HEPN domain-containing protein [Cytobacillus firmus]
MSGMQAMKQTMFDEFEIKGYWWIPGKQEDQVAGILFFTEDKIHLELIGSLSDDFLSMGNEKYEIILGFSDKGEQFTLLNVNVKKSETNAPGFQTQTYSIQSFIVGGYFVNQEEIQFHSMNFQPTYLTEWLGRPVFVDKTTFEKDKSSILGKEVSYNKYDTFNHYVDVLGATIEETYNSKFKADLSEKVLWTNKSVIKIIPNENKDLSWFSSNMYILKDLLNLFIGHATYFESIAFYGEEQKMEHTDKMYRKKYMYFFRQNKSKLKEKFNWSDVIVNFNDIENGLNNILNFWFEKHSALEVVYNLHFDEFYKDMYINTTFLNTVQILEIYHRKMYEGKVYHKKEYRALAKELKEILDEKFPEAFAKIIGNKVDYGNEYSLSMRIEEILNGFNETTRNLLIGTEEDINKFIRQLVETRNYLTHYDSDKKKHILMEPFDKYFAVQRLRAIATLILFKEVGLDETVMIDKICNSKQYSYGLREAKKLLN